MKPFTAYCGFENQVYLLDEYCTALVGRLADISSGLFLNYLQ